MTTIFRKESYGNAMPFIYVLGKNVTLDFTSNESWTLRDLQGTIITSRSNYVSIDKVSSVNGHDIYLWKDVKRKSVNTFILREDADAYLFDSSDWETQGRISGGVTLSTALCKLKGISEELKTSLLNELTTLIHRGETALFKDENWRVLVKDRFMFSERRTKERLIRMLSDNTPEDYPDKLELYFFRDEMRYKYTTDTVRLFILLKAIKELKQSISRSIPVEYDPFGELSLHQSPYLVEFFYFKPGDVRSIKGRNLATNFFNCENHSNKDIMVLLTKLILIIFKYIRLNQEDILKKECEDIDSLAFMLSTSIVKVDNSFSLVSMSEVERFHNDIRKIRSARNNPSELTSEINEKFENLKESIISKVREHLDFDEKDGQNNNLCSGEILLRYMKKENMNISDIFTENNIFRSQGLKEVKILSSYRTDRIYIELIFNEGRLLPNIYFKQGSYRGRQISIEEQANFRGKWFGDRLIIEISKEIPTFGRGLGNVKVFIKPDIEVKGDNCYIPNVWGNERLSHPETGETWNRYCTGDARRITEVINTITNVNFNSAVNGDFVRFLGIYNLGTLNN